MRRCCLWLIAACVVSGFQSEEEELENRFARNRQLNQQAASSYGGNPSYYNPSQSPLSRNVCRGRTGYVADTSRNCQVFYNCLTDGTVTTSTCPGNFQFDETTQCCKMPHDVNCAGLLDGGGNFQPTISCSGKRGFFPDLHSGCQIFYFCEPSGRSRQLNCPDGLLFNELIGCCDVAQNVNCGGQVRPYPPATSPLPDSSAVQFCRNLRPGFYANPTDCSAYYVCQAAGRSSALRCPAGQAFNDQIGSCDNDLSRCYGVQVDNSVFDCTGRNGWYHPTDNDPRCRLAFYCNAGLTYQHTCPVNLRWNQLTLSCDSPDRVPCGSDLLQPQQTVAPPPATSQPPPYYNTGPGSGYGAGAVVYAYTPRPNVPQPTYTYPSVTVTTNNAGFPGYGYGDTTQGDIFANPGLGIDRTYDCRGKIGYYAVQETGCSQFIYCNPEGTAHRFDCPSTLLFNNSLALCDWPQNVHCGNQVVPGYLPSTLGQPSFDCRGKDGFFADQNRGGRIFYLCHADGIKYQYVCPSNLVFNEQSSVCDWPDFMRNGGFTQRTPTDLSQSIAVDWNGQGLDCRLRPAGFYANPNNNMVYGRCTPDGTFIPMRCPQTTVFDQALGQCVFPFQLGQGRQTGGTQTYTGTGTITTNYGNADVNYAVQGSGGTYGQNTQTDGGQNSGNGDGVNYAVQGGTYGNTASSGAYVDGQSNPSGTNGIDGSNYAVQGGTYGQGEPENPNQVVQTGAYGQANSGFSGSGGSYAPDVNSNQNEGLSGNQGTLYGNPGGGDGYVENTPATSQIRPYNPRPGNSQTGFYSSTPSNPGIDYYTQIGGNSPSQTGYSNEQYSNNQVDSYGGSGFYQPAPVTDYATQGPYGSQWGYNTDSGISGYGSQVQSPVSRQPGGLTIGINIKTHGVTPVVCIGRTGIFADRTTQCRSYTICRADGTSDTRMCAGNLVFNEQTNRCDVPQNTNCFANSPGIMQPNVPVCLQPGNSVGTFVPDTTQSCTTFYSCEKNGQGIGFRCPAGQQFNSRINACDDIRSCNCAATNGGTITVHLPVSAPYTDNNYNTAYSANSQQVNRNNIDLDITVRKTADGTMPLVPGYDTSLYADQSGSRSRLPTFFSDDANIPVTFNISAEENSTVLSLDDLHRATEEAALLQMAAAESARLFVSKPPRLSNMTATKQPMANSDFQKANSSSQGDIRVDHPRKQFGNILMALAATARRNKEMAGLTAR